MTYTIRKLLAGTLTLVVETVQHGGDYRTCSYSVSKWHLEQHGKRVEPEPWTHQLIDDQLYERGLEAFNLLELLAQEIGANDSSAAREFRAQDAERRQAGMRVVP